MKNNIKKFSRFKIPTFLSGFVKSIDLFSTTSLYRCNLKKTSDSAALQSDWEKIGCDMKKVIGSRSKVKNK